MYLSIATEHYHPTVREFPITQLSEGLQGSREMPEEGGCVGEFQAANLQLPA